MPWAQQLLQVWTGKSKYVSFPDDLSNLDVPETGVRHHKQVRDAYLEAVAMRSGVRLATFDSGLAMLHGKAVELIVPAAAPQPIPPPPPPSPPIS